jgi:hypothetical protein
MILGGLLTPWSTSIAQAPTENTEAIVMPSRMVLVDSNSIVGISSPESPNLASRADIISDIDRTYSERGDDRGLIECLARVESTNNEKAVNPMDTDGRPKFGLLQFDARTFQYWCVSKYGLPDDIFSGDVQRTCAGLMIDAGQSYQWPTAKKYCL